MRPNYCEKPLCKHYEKVNFSKDTFFFDTYFFFSFKPTVFIDQNCKVHGEGMKPATHEAVATGVEADAGSLLSGPARALSDRFLHSDGSFRPNSSLF